MSYHFVSAVCILHVLSELLHTNNSPVFILNCRLDYCSSLFLCISDGLMSRLQLVQNSTAPLVSGAWHCVSCSILQPHNAGIPSTALAISMPVHGFQGCHAFIGHCPEIICHTMILFLSPMLVTDNYTSHRVGHASSPGPMAPLVTELLLQPVPGCGTVYRHISEMQTYRTVGSGDH